MKHQQQRSNRSLRTNDGLRRGWLTTDKLTPQTVVVSLSLGERRHPTLKGIGFPTGRSVPGRLRQQGLQAPVPAKSAPDNTMWVRQRLVDNRPSTANSDQKSIICTPLSEIAPLKPQGLALRGYLC